MLRHALVALAVMALGQGVQASWDAPEGTPYRAETKQLPVPPGPRHQLAFQEGMAAWLEPLSEDPSQSGYRLAYLDVDEGATLDSTEPTPFFDAAQAPAVTSSHLAWLYFGNSSREWSNWQSVDAELYVRNLTSGALWKVYSAYQIKAPTLTGSFLAWASHDPQRPVPQQVHRLDLETGLRQDWPTPPALGMPQVFVAGRDLLLWSDRQSSDAPTEPNLHQWNPATGDLRPLATNVHTLSLDGDFASFGAVDDHGSMNLHALGISTGVSRQVTWSPGRETMPSLSGTLLAWADTGRGESGRARDPVYDVYFMDLITSNEYRLEGSRHFDGNYLAGPILDGRRLLYNDVHGTLTLAYLPAQEELLTVAVTATVTEGAGLVVSVTNATGIQQAWDTDLDGTFEHAGELPVALDASGLPSLANASLQAIDPEGRLAVLHVDVMAAFGAARQVTSLAPQDDTLKFTAPPPEESHGLASLTMPVIVLALLCFATGVRRRP